MNQEYRDLLKRTILGAVRTSQDCQLLVESVRAGSWDEIVPDDTAYATAVALIIRAAIGQGWIRDLVKPAVCSLPQIDAVFDKCF